MNDANKTWADAAWWGMCIGAFLGGAGVTGGLVLLTLVFGDGGSCS